MNKPYVVVAFPVVDWPEMRSMIAPSLEDEMTHTYQGMSREDFNKLDN